MQLIGSGSFTRSRFNEAAGIHRRKLHLQPPHLQRLGHASMRPPEFTGGNPHHFEPSTQPSYCFNEAAGIHRRKPPLEPPCVRIATGFNEAAGIHRRKRAVPRRHRGRSVSASMRPPEFTGGNLAAAAAELPGRAGASMRPPEFTGGNRTVTTKHGGDQRMLQ